MSKKWISNLKKILVSSMSAVLVVTLPMGGACALSSKEVFSRIPSTPVSYDRTCKEWDLYSDIFSLKQCDEEESRDGEHEFHTPITNTIVNATKLWSSDDMGTAIATQSPGGFCRWTELLPRFIKMLLEVENPTVVVLGPVKSRMFCSSPGDIIDYFSKWGFSDAQAMDSRLRECLKSDGEKCCACGADEYTIRCDASEDSPEKEIPLFHFSKWEDSKIPRSSEDKDCLERLIVSFKDDNTSALIVHCSAGIGRTGVFFACLRALKTGECNPVKIVSYLRKHRTNMVQRPEQFDYICKFILRNLCGMRDLSWDIELTDEHFARLGITE